MMNNLTNHWTFPYAVASFLLWLFRPVPPPDYPERLLCEKIQMNLQVSVLDRFEKKAVVYCKEENE